jgi:beta-galactosamide-alpha-2,3-sialyltransferase
MNNYFLCRTPFHVAMALRIIKRFNISKPILFIIADSNRDKVLSYIESYKGDVKYFCFIKKSGSKILNFISFVYFSILCQFRGNIYISAIHDKYALILLNFINFLNIYTYDDGIANINYTGIFFQKNKHKFLNWTEYRIRMETKKHYTIFKNCQNICENTMYFSFFEKNRDYTLLSQGKKVKIFIGQPYNEIFDERFSKDKLEKIVSTLGIDYYVQHPREKEVDLNIPCIESSGVLEEFIFDYFGKKLDIEVYTFLSTSVLILSDCPKVTCFAIRNSFLQSKYHAIYDMYDKFKINMIEVDLV